MAAEDIIRADIAFARRAGIRVTRGPVYEWGSDQTKPVAVNALGAVMYASGNARPGFPSGWQRVAEGRLGVSRSWLDRFCLGWDRGYQVELAHKDRLVHDDVSALAIRMRREV